MTKESKDKTRNATIATEEIRYKTAGVLIASKDKLKGH